MELSARLEKILIGVIAVWVAVVSLWNFRSNPPYWFDEGIYHQVVSNLHTSGTFGVRLTPTSFSNASLISVGYPVFYPAVVMFSLFGDSGAHLRLVAIAFVWGFLAVAYVYVRQRYSVKEALLSLLLFSLFSPLFGNGKSFLGEVPGMFYFVSGLVLYGMAEKRKERAWIWMFLSGMSLGLAASTKPTFLIIIPAIAVGVLWKWREFFMTREGNKKLAFLVLGMITSLSIWVVTQFGITSSYGTIFSHYANPYHIEHISSTVLSNLKRFVTESTPMHLLGMLLIVTFGFLLKLKRREPLAFSEIVLLAFIGATLVFYVRTAGWYRYFFPAHLLLFLLFPVNLVYLVRHVPRLPQKYGSIGLVVMFGALVLLQGQVMGAERFKQGPDAPTEFDTYLQTMPGEREILFYSVPQIAARYPGSNFSQYLRMSDWLILGSENLERFQKGEFSRVIMEIPPIDLKIPPCYTREVTIRKIVVFQRNMELSCQ